MARVGDCVVNVVGIGRVATLVGWGVIAVALGGAIVAARLSHGRFPGGVALLRAGMHNRVARVLVLAGWLWVGWHFFVRTSR
jgi:hypothetical protein